MAVGSPWRQQSHHLRGEREGVGEEVLGKGLVGGGLLSGGKANTKFNGVGGEKLLASGSSP